MKMKQEHFDELKRLLDKFLKPRKHLVDSYKGQKLGKERFSWDVLHAVVDYQFIKVLYTYLNDNHINTALNRIIEF